jgi:predicted transcriptional regulator
MAKRASGGDSKRLTDVELELMTILWRRGEGTVNDVIAHLARERELAYTSVSTILRILETKGVLKTRKEGRGHVYVPLLGKADYEARAVSDVVERVFQGVPVALVRQLLDSGKLTDTDLREVRKLLARSKGRK